MTAAHSRIQAGVLQQTPLEVMVSPQGLWDHRAKEETSSPVQAAPSACPWRGKQPGGGSTGWRQADPMQLPTLSLEPVSLGKCPVW